MKMRPGFLEHGGLWPMAIAVSIGLHVGLLLLLSCCHSSESAAKARVESPEKAPVQEASAPKPDATPTSPSEPEVRLDADTETKPVSEVKPPPFRERKPSRKATAGQKVADKEPEIAKDPDETEPKPDARQPDAKPSAAAKTETYSVKKGDTLTSVAKEHGCTVSELAKLNKTTIKKLSNLKFGQRIKVPKAD